ncbi:leucine-rich repeat extensin-like protein 5 [Camellia sinensis]|uniref:leucine-rich repeat extensin-like protein 5 n=1 Tax=Camellia sinensis TaxID=4442 RepID=UPI001035D10E|nr:leucine-rich repeat extensin-like protein 5 [Camellia sinensis]
MNRNLKESMIGGRNIPAGTQHRRGLSLTGMSRDADENLDLFSRNRRSLSVASSDESDGTILVKLGKLSVGSAKLAKSGMDDLLSSAEGGKHDYDWLLTPPGTPLFPSLNGSESQPPSAAPRSSSTVRSVSTTKASRLSVSQSENNHHSRPIRSSSVTRPSISSTQYSTYSNKSTSILNTSSASVSSYIRPSTPTTRSSSTARPSTPSAHSVPSRSSTPSKPRPSLTSSSIERTRPSQNSRPSTPSSRPQIPANLNTSVNRSASRPSTPTRRNSAPSLPSAAATSLSTATGSSVRAISNGRSTATGSRPSSPSPRVRPVPQPMILPDFSLETPPNLRTTLPNRPLSAGRSRPGVAVTGKGNVESPTVNLPRRQPSPVISRGRLTESTTRGRLHANGQAVDTMESRKALHVSDLLTRKPVKTSATSTDNSGFGRNISKKSLDMAIRHMDIRNGTSNTRPLSRVPI